MIRTNNPVSPKTIYVNAIEKFSQQSVYLPVHVEVEDQAGVVDLINRPPYFVTELDGLMIDIG